MGMGVERPEGECPGRAGRQGHEMRESLRELFEHLGSGDRLLPGDGAAQIQGGSLSAFGIAATWPVEGGVHEAGRADHLPGEGLHGTLTSDGDLQLILPTHRQSQLLEEVLDDVKVRRVLDRLELGEALSGSPGLTGGLSGSGRAVIRLQAPTALQVARRFERSADGPTAVGRLPSFLVPFGAHQGRPAEEPIDPLDIPLAPEGQETAESEVGCRVVVAVAGEVAPFKEPDELLAVPRLPRAREKLRVFERSRLAQRSRFRDRLPWTPPEEFGVERRQLPLAGFNGQRRSGDVLPRDGEVPGAVVHLDPALAVAPDGEFGLKEELQATAAWGDFRVGAQPVDDLLSPRLDLSLLVEAVIEVDASKRIGAGENEPDAIEPAVLMEGGLRLSGAPPGRGISCRSQLPGQGIEGNLGIVTITPNVTPHDPLRLLDKLPRYIVPVH